MYSTSAEGSEENDNAPTSANSTKMGLLMRKHSVLQVTNYDHVTNYGHIYAFVPLTFISISANLVVTRKSLGCSYDFINSPEYLGSDLCKIFLSNIFY